uniref:Uncharacterized protein n=1 Tax=viral metagenome TaxID=1070528 RepID=A0A6C0BPP6_9ZZZZ
MDNFENFKIALYRQVPQVAAAAEHLVQLFNRVSRQTQELKGNLEIESFFGRSKDGKFSNHVEEDVIQVVQKMLLECSTWTCTEDWHIMYDYYLDDHQTRVRVSYKDEKQQVNMIRKHRLGHVDLSYGQMRKSEWKLTDYLTRVTLKFEEPLTSPQNTLLHFKSVKMSMRKSFIVPSHNCSAVRWRFELVQFWVSDSMESLEHSIQTEAPQYSMECELLDLPDALSETDKYIMFASLLMKMEDFYTFPLCRLIAINEGQQQSQLPTFLVQS